jgi:ribosomal protein S6--L-glutamate ligase
VKSAVSVEAAQGELMPVTPAERALAVRCRRLFGLDLYGIDCIRTPEGPVVIEVNEFPNYTGVPEASDRLADHVLARATRVQERRPQHAEVEGT